MKVVQTYIEVEADGPDVCDTLISSLLRTRSISQPPWFHLISPNISTINHLTPVAYTTIVPTASPSNSHEALMIEIYVTLGWFKKTQFLGNQLLFHFLDLYVEKKTLAKAVACTMVFNTALRMQNLSLNSQNRLFSCSGIGLLIGFLVFHPIKIISWNPKPVR